MASFVIAGFFLNRRPAIHTSTFVTRRPPSLIRTGSQAATRRRFTLRAESDDRKSHLQQFETPKWDVKVLYDGDCPVCLKEIRFLRWMDEKNRRIGFQDITSPLYNPEENSGIDYTTAMREIHAVLPDGRVITGMEVFRMLYAAIGLG
mmetsp:Transcript_15197/g.26040  ORF Transcript_15197/g.26040 Transcript_15197/m.26040 type:complete len:148 (-) Transcript_15197:37-480(-)